MKISSKILLLSMILPIFLLSHADAFYEPGILTLTPNAGINMYDTSANINTGPTLGLKLDYGISSSQAGSINLEAIANTTQLKSSNGGGSAGAFLLSLGPLYCFPEFENITPLISAGIGTLIASSKVNSMPGVSSLLTVGFGASYRLSKQMTVRADLSRLFILSLNGSNGFEMSLGLSYSVGSVKKSMPLVESTPNPVVKRRKRGAKGVKAVPAEQVAPEAVQPATAAGNKATPVVPGVAAKAHVPSPAPSVSDAVKAPSVEATTAAAEAAPAIVAPAAPASETIIPETKDTGAEPSLPEVQSVMTARQKVRSAAPSPVVETAAESAPVPTPAPDSKKALAQATVIQEAAPAIPAPISPAPVTTVAAPEKAEPDTTKAGTIPAKPALPESVQSAVISEQKAKRDVSAPPPPPAAEAATDPSQGTAETKEDEPVISAPVTPGPVSAAPKGEAGKPETKEARAVAAGQKAPPETPAPAMEGAGAQVLLPTSATETTSTPAGEKPGTALIASPLAPTSTSVPLQATPAPAAAQPEAKETGAVAARTAPGEEVLPVPAALQKAKSESPAPAEEADAVHEATPVAEAGKTETKKAGVISAAPAPLETDKFADIPVQKTQQEAAAAPDSPVPTQASVVEEATPPAPGKAEVKEAMPVVSTFVTPAAAQAVPAPAVKPEAKETGMVAVEPALPETVLSGITATQEVRPAAPSPIVETAAESAPVSAPAPDSRVALAQAPAPVTEAATSQATRQPAAASAVTTPAPAPARFAPALGTTRTETKDAEMIAAETALPEAAQTVPAAEQKAIPKAPAPAAETAAVPAPAPSPAAEPAPAAAGVQPENKETGAVASKQTLPETTQPAVLPEHKSQPEAAVTAEVPPPTSIPAEEVTPAPGKPEIKKALPVASAPVTEAAVPAAPAPETAQPETGKASTVAAKPALPETVQPAGIAESKEKLEAPAHAAEIAIVPAPTPAPATEATSTVRKPEAASAMVAPVAPAPAGVQLETKETGAVADKPVVPETAHAAVVPEQTAQPGASVTAEAPTPAPAPESAPAEALVIPEAEPATTSPAAATPAPVVAAPGAGKHETNETGVTAKPGLPETAQLAVEAGQKAEPEVSAPAAEAAPFLTPRTPEPPAPAAAAAVQTPAQTAPAPSPAQREAKETGAIAVKPSQRETAQPVLAPEQKAKPEAPAPAAGISEAAPAVVAPAILAAVGIQPEEAATSEAPAPSPVPSVEAVHAPVPVAAENREAMPVIFAPASSAPVQAPTASAALTDKTPVAQAEPGAQRGTEPLMEELLTDENEPSLRGLRNVKTAMTIRFASGNSTIDPSYHGRLRKIAAMVKADPGLQIRIAAHTDNLGNAHANYLFSQKRARSVKDYFVKTLGVDARRVSAKGYGHYQPVADNATAEGRRKNRRVVTIVLTTE